MALYELTDEQRVATLDIIGNASIPGRAAALVASIQRALSTPTVQIGGGEDGTTHSSDEGGNADGKD